MPTSPGPVTKLTPELAQRIWLLLMEGMSLRRICEMKGLPAKGTVMSWLAKEDEENGPYAAFQDQYARARKVQAETLVDEIMDIADDGSNDYMTITKGDKEYNVEEGGNQPL
ncbi:hypothetical protein DNI29_16880 [Hymenobacter sediminis]|uniref:terminase small subunit-like protein n=1 Tax=Hymenobacter sediminis TaxID=2218621 RepID=UPI000DA66E90|nr:hypothetical protein [Hymenobacter sediminis]RPD45824.1 hypothetical protein DNI29_16880 [Hymenobacter sediminis]